MRTTVNIDEDVSRAVEQIRQKRGLGLSEAINAILREGVSRKPAKRPYKHRTHAMEIRIDVTNTAEALEQLEGSRAR